MNHFGSYYRDLLFPLYTNIISEFQLEFVETVLLEYSVLLLFTPLNVTWLWCSASFKFQVAQMVKEDAH